MFLFAAAAATVQEAAGAAAGHYPAWSPSALCCTYCTSEQSPYFQMILNLHFVSSVEVWGNGVIVVEQT